MFVVLGLNWKTPGAVFVAGPTTVQLLSGNDRVVVVSTVKGTPGSLLLKANWNMRLLSTVGPISVGSVVGAGVTVSTAAGEEVAGGGQVPLTITWYLSPLSGSVV